MEKNKKILLGATCFLGGVVTGLLVPSIKKVVYYCNDKEENVDEKETTEAKEELVESVDEALVNDSQEEDIKEEVEEVVEEEVKTEV